MTIPRPSPKNHRLNFIDTVGLSGEGTLGVQLAVTAAVAGTVVVREMNDVAVIHGTVTNASDSAAHVLNGLAVLGGVDAVDRLLWWIIHTLENPLDPEVVVYAWALVIVLGGAILGRRYSNGRR